MGCKKDKLKKDKEPFRSQILEEVRDIQRKRVTHGRPLENDTVPSYIATVEKPRKEETIKTLKSSFPNKNNNSS